MLLAEWCCEWLKLNADILSRRLSSWLMGCSYFRSFCRFFCVAAVGLNDLFASEQNVANIIGWIFFNNCFFVVNLLLSLSVKEFWKSVKPIFKIHSASILAKLEPKIEWHLFLVLQLNDWQTQCRQSWVEAFAPVFNLRLYTVSKKRCHHNHGYNFVNSWCICKILSLLQRAVNFQQNQY